MELLVDLWNFNPGLRLKLLLLSLVGLMVLIIRSFGQMSTARMAAGREGRITPATYAIVGRDEPEDLAVYTRLSANLFEMPTVFMVLVLAFATAGIESWLTVVLAWLYVALRWQHAHIMTSGNRVMARRKAFIRSMQVFMLMLAEFVISLLFFADL
ncbi:MAG: MAPEG family protein [Pseudomonadota bacterium]